MPNTSDGQMMQDKLPKDSKPPLQLHEEQLRQRDQSIAEARIQDTLISIQPQSIELIIENCHRFKVGHQEHTFKLNYSFPLI